MYTVRFDEKESGYVEIATVATLEEAKAEFKRQLAFDKAEGTTDVRTQIIDDNENVIEEYEGENY